MNKSYVYDDIVVGAGIVGLAHAYTLGKLGRKVLVIERSPRAIGASVRNFGMIWPVGQPADHRHELALRSREIWLEVLQQSGIWHCATGSLHLAYREDELDVLSEYVKLVGGSSGRILLNTADTLKHSSAILADGLLGSMWSPTELCVDPRDVAGALPGWLQRTFGVETRYCLTVTSCEPNLIVTGGEAIRAERIWVCSGDELGVLFPKQLGEAGLKRCKLQMMRSQPFGSELRIGPMLAAGLTLTHYASFRICPSLSLLTAKLANEHPELCRYGIHVMASQNGAGEITLGDSHEYGADIEPFDNPEIDRLILDYLTGFLAAPNLEIRSRWHGIYVKHPTLPYLVLDPAPGVTVTTGLGGAGMTLSFGVAERVVRERLELAR